MIITHTMQAQTLAEGRLNIENANANENTEEKIKFPFLL